MSSTLSAPVSENYSAALDRLIADVVGPAAAQVDKDGAFPTQNIQALGAAGILGLLSATEVGGGGLALRDAADVIEGLGTDGGGLDLALTLVLPAFQVLSAAFSLGVMDAVTAETANHLNA